jgi:hypothetical protein
MPKKINKHIPTLLGIQEAEATSGSRRIECSWYHVDNRNNQRKTTKRLLKFHRIIIV